MIIPAIIPKSLEDLGNTLNKLGFAPKVQIDLVDGQFVPFSSWPYEPHGEAREASSILSGKKFEVDLMSKDQIEAASKWLEMGAEGVIFHIEGLDNPEQVFPLKEKYSFKLGFALENGTPLDKVYPFIDKLDFVQLMGIAEIGSQGQPFDSRVLDRIATLRSLYPDLEIGIDGGVNERTITQLKQAGATRFVSGSAILNAESPQASYEQLLKISSE